MRRDQKIDWLTIGLFLLLVFLGWLNQYFLEKPENRIIFSLSNSSGKQLFFTGIALGIGIIFLVLDTKFLEFLSAIFYIISIALLILVLFVKTTKGASSWFEIGGFKIQPTEFAKLATVMALAKFMSKYNFNMKKQSDFMTTIAIIGLPALLVLLQNDPGSFLTFSAFGLVLFREGLNPVWIIATILTGLVATAAILMLKVPYSQWILSAILIGLGALTWYRIFKQKYLGIHIAVVLAFVGVVFTISTIVQPHHVRRIRVLVASKKELQEDKIMKHKEYYHLRQSLIGVGSGGFWGKGWGKGTHNQFVPESHNDYVFSVWSHEHGFFGSIILFILYGVITLRVLFMADNSKTDYARVFGHGLFAFLAIHILINISMTLGLFPSVGIPLPFLSYGGSSMISFTAMLFILMNHFSYRVNILR